MTSSRAGALAALTVLVLAPAVASEASAQPLAEIARREQARRETVDKPAKIYTNEDLRPYPGTDPVAGGAETADAAGETADGAAEREPAAASAADASATERSRQGSAAGPAGAATTPESAGPAERDEDYWRSRIGVVRSLLERNELFLEALQSRINALTTDFVNIDDPAQRALVAIDRQRAQSELERVQAEVDRLGDEIAEIQEEARRAGVPPGWLR